MQTRNESITPNPNNSVTKKRKKLGSSIMKEAEGNSSAAYSLSIRTLENYIPRLQEFVLSHSEEPAQDVNDLIKQVYQLRMNDVTDASDILDFDTEEGKTHLEQQENDFETDYGYVRDEFLGELFAPIEIAYNHLNKQAHSDEGFLGANIAGTAIPIIGEKVNKATLIRAAQGKPSGIVGFLSTGGKKHYELLVAYFKKYPDYAKQVLTGQISDESQLPNWYVTKPTSKNPLIPITDDLVRDQFKKAIPYIIGLLLLIGIIVYFAARSKK